MNYCVRCGCTESHACEGGCAWVICPSTLRPGLCTQCLSPAECHAYAQREAMLKAAHDLGLLFVATIDKCHRLTRRRLKDSK